ncbi:hypothetical protein W97_02380 [Coniosporium apollinis CBS 100218]|uniref:NTF2 domain-containing protein n=1 Tax=Coniosporium apollinis (strain CBS 100218) TaxID=1168221 RepID=R7YMS1_CONA1|nr:uncharacterized protein W97_02380 [Coniosporium apollinis CBS 100218]EON63153.1 hypothetical protein W97_02380 [Coniosporium apollinis CBS 100218]
MATEHGTMPVNGTFGSHQTQGYGASEHNYGAHNTNNVTSANAGYGAGAATANAQQSSEQPHAEVPKDEVGWYFVESYYTTLSRQPEKLYLFYNKRSQFVSGDEETKLPVCIGQKAINERIRELDFQDCKVRVTNVDSQGSDSSIVIQVIGEMSNKSQPRRKFVQTFVLAEQTNGYFVLNDIFRYLKEDEEELVEGEETQPEQPAATADIEEPAPPAEDPTPKTLTSSEDTAAQGYDAEQVDKELEEVIRQDETAEKETSPPPAAVINGTPVPETDIDEAEEAPVAATTAEESQEDAPSTAEAAEASPKPSPVAEPAKPAPAPPAAQAPPPKPAAPKTWASLAASANRPKAAPPAPAPAPAQASAPSVSASETPATPTAPARETSPATSQGDSSSGWQAVGGDNKRQSRAQAQSTVTEQPNTRAYIKNVHEGIEGEALRSALTKYGELRYLDISRQRSCAFVDFATPAGYEAAIAANPLVVGSDQLIVEERRMRPGQYEPFRGRPGGPRGRGDGRGGQGRGGFKQDGPRGGFPPRGRGNVTPRGRGGPQAA